ncbi:MAG: hypothetical protein AB1758_07130 [Candidatus Eremiobacterota bacterium]
MGPDDRLSSPSALSQGERQLLSFARALVVATANIDSRTEQAVQTALKTMLLGRTAVFVALRLSTVQQVQSQNAAKILAELLKSGRARRVADEQVDAEEAVLVSQCQSDDPHVIALARVAGVRLLCTDDRTLKADFRNHKLVNQPSGEIYSPSKHAQKLKKHCTP